MNNLNQVLNLIFEAAQTGVNVLDISFIDSLFEAWGVPMAFLDDVMDWIL